MGQHGSPSRVRTLARNSFVILFVIITSFVPAPPNKLRAFARQAQLEIEQAVEAYENRHLEAARDHFQRATQLVPYNPVLHFNLACCWARLGNADEAFRSLDRAIQYGFEDVEALLSNAALALIGDDPRFDEALKSAAACRDEDLLLYVGTGVDPARPAPVLILFHGLGDSPRSVLPAWRAAADELGLIIAAPRGVNRIAPNRFAWHPQHPAYAADLDIDKSYRAVENAIAHIRTTHQHDPQRIALAGISQGGHLAFRTLHDHPEQFCGVFTLISVYHSPDADYWKGVAPKRAFLIAGMQDKIFHMSRKAQNEMEAAGFKVRLDPIPQMRHEMPLDLTWRQIRALKFVLRK